MLGRPHGIGLGTQQGQDDGLNGLALQVGQAPTQIQQRPGALLAPGEQGLKALMKGQQLFGAGGHIPRRQSADRSPPTDGRFAWSTAV
jgi:hypothetical protein